MARAAKDAANGNGRAKRGGSNAPTESEVREHLNDLHDLHDAMDAKAGEFRSKIKAAQDKACEKLGVTKKALHVLFRKERRDMKDAKWAKSADTHDRDALLKLSTSLGETPLGAFAQRLAEGIPNEAPAD